MVSEKSKSVLKREAIQRGENLASTPTPTPTPVQPGQLWMDMDKRQDGKRFVRVIEIGHLGAVCRTFFKGVDGVLDAPKGRYTISKIRLDRFKLGSTGYSLVTSAEEAGLWEKPV